MSLSATEVQVQEPQHAAPCSFQTSRQVLSPIHCRILAIVVLMTFVTNAENIT